jgi:hypothetical protein
VDFAGLGVLSRKITPHLDEIVRNHAFFCFGNEGGRFAPKSRSLMAAGAKGCGSVCCATPMLAEGQVFEDKIPARAEDDDDPTDQVPEEGDHGQRILTACGLYDE